MHPSRLKAEGEHHLLHLQVAILLCTVMCFFSIEKFNEKLTRSSPAGCDRVERRVMTIFPSLLPLSGNSKCDQRDSSFLAEC